MDKIWIMGILLLGYVILSNKWGVNEGFENPDDPVDDTVDDPVDDPVEDPVDDPVEEENCEYRKKRKGKILCGASELSKWGEPPCSSWEISANMKGLSKRKQTVLKGYYPNDFMYEIDYKEYSTSKLVDDTDADDKADTDDKGGKDDEPRGVHSSFFS
jgi:hypothetical protein